MINKRLINTVKGSKKYIAGNVICQWISLAANITMMAAIAGMLQDLYLGTDSHIGLTAVIAAVAVMVRFLCAVAASRMGYLSSKAVKKTLREMIYRKLLRLGSFYREQANTSEVVQVAVEGVDQLETYFGAYLPQFFYAMLAPLTLFAVLRFVNLPSATVLLVCVPLIPVTIILIQRWAKKLLSKYWGQYTALGDTFLENLQGLTTTEIYQENLKDFAAGRGMTGKAKMRIMVTVTLLMSIGLLMMGMSGILTGCIVLGCVWIFHIVYFLFAIKTIPTTEATAA